MRQFCFSFSPKFRRCFEKAKEFGRQFFSKYSLKGTLHGAV